MKELRTEIEINAPTDTVWAILTDLGQFAAEPSFVQREAFRECWRRCFGRASTPTPGKASRR